MSAPAIRPMSIGEVLDTSFGIYRRLFPTLALVSLVTLGFPLVWGIFETMRGAGPMNLLSTSIRLVVTVILSSIGTAASTFIVSESYLGRTLSYGEALSRAVPFIGRLFMLSVLTSLLVGVGFFLLIVPGIIAVSGLILGTPAMVIENQPGATAAMSRSWALTRGSRVRILGVLLVGFLLMMVPYIAIGGLTGLFVSRGPETERTAYQPVVLVLLLSLIQVLVYPLFYVALTVLYYDARVRHEAFDLEVLAASLTRA